MIRILTDTHTHTIFSQHAYGTMKENIDAAVETRLEAIGITDHYSNMFWPVDRFENFGNFCNRKAVPKEWKGVKVFHGVEADIIDTKGHLFGYDRDLKDTYMKGFDGSWLDLICMNTDYAIGSVHGMDFLEGTTESQVTDMYCKVLENPHVMILGHIGRSKHTFDLETVLACAKEKGKLVELNQPSINRNNGYREGFATRMLTKCAEMGVGISVGTDAHSPFDVGRFDSAISLLNEVDFPEELIMIRNLKSLMSVLDRID